MVKPKLVTVKPLQKRAPVMSTTESKAYRAAWRIIQGPQPPTHNKHLACASTRRSQYVDWLAEVIQKEMSR